MLSRLTLRQKFTLLAGLALLMTLVPTALLIHRIDGAIDYRLLKAQGLAPEQAVLTAIKLTQQHRGMAARLLNGDDSAAAPRQALQGKVDQAYARVDALLAAMPEQAPARDWQVIDKQWREVKALFADGKPTPAQSFKAHTALIGHMLEDASHMLDAFKLSLDTDLDTYQLVQGVFVAMPRLTEALGQLRGKGAGLLARQAATFDERNAIEALRQQALASQRQLSYAFGQATRANPAFAAHISTSLQDAAALLDKGLTLAEQQIVTPEQLSASASDYFTTLTQVINAQFALSDTALDVLQQRLSEQIADMQYEKWGLLGVIAGVLLVAFWLGLLVVRSILRPIFTAVDVAHQVAAGDLSARLDVQGQDECAQLLRALNEMNEGLAHIVSEVRSGAQAIATSAEQIAAANIDMSRRTEQQAASLEETSASMEQINTMVARNADHTRQANQLAVDASGSATCSGEVIGRVVTTMSDITEASSRMADIIGLIDDIAFQTNLLALNASVEAARAGAHGRGFAVVASEVRALAGRSAAAAKDIKTLIDTSRTHVAAGEAHVSESGEAMKTLVSDIQRVSAIIREIDASSGEQRSGIEQIHKAIVHMDSVTQQNAAMVEQTSAAASSLEEQTAALHALMDKFRLTTAHADRVG